MGRHVEIENIEEMRRMAGIDDVELRGAIRALRVGDHVKLTFLPDARPSAGETLLVRITSIRGSRFRGTLATRPASQALGELRAGSRLIFTAAHIHSLPEGRVPHAP